MQYPIFKKNENFKEFDVILDESMLFSVRNGDVLAIGAVENSNAVKQTLQFDDSTREEFEHELNLAINRFRAMFAAKKYGNLLIGETFL